MLRGPPMLNSSGEDPLGGKSPPSPAREDLYETFDLNSPTSRAEVSCPSRNGKQTHLKETKQKGKLDWNRAN